MKKKSFKVIGYIFTVISFVFIARAIYSVKPDISLIKNPFLALADIVFASVVLALNVYLSAIAWKYILEFLCGHKLTHRDIVKVYVKSNIGKYIPGNIMHFVGRNVLGKKLGVDQINIAVGTGIEITALIFYACFWSVVLARKNFEEALRASVSHIGILPLAIICSVAVILAGIAAAYGIKKGYFQRVKFLFAKGFKRLCAVLFVIYSITLITPGVFLALFFSHILAINVTWQMCVFITASYVASWSIGYMLPGAPGGIGIREFSLLLMLRSVCKTESILAAIVLHRIASILGDLFAFLIEMIMSKKYSLSKKQLVKAKTGDFLK